HDEISGKPGSGAQTLAAAGAAGGEDLAAAGGGEAGTEAVTGVAAPFCGVVLSLPGAISADNLPLKLTICLINEVSPLTLAGPNWAIFRPKKTSPPGRTGPSRTMGAVYRGAT